MMEGLRPYPAMKDSGVSWLGEVPRHWDVKRLRNVTAYITSGSRGWSNYAADEGPLFVRIGNLTRTSIDLDWRDAVRLKLPPNMLGECKRTRVQSGDLLLSITAFIGSVAVAPEGMEEAYVSQHVACCRLDHEAALPRWLGYLILSPVGQTHGQLCMYGGTKQGLSLDDVKNHIVILPPLSEQAAIVRFLEHVERRVRRYMRAKRKLIRLLEEQKQAIIHQAVTRGLDPDVRLRSSGVEWLGDIPEHWEICRNGRLFIQRNQTGFANLPILEVSLRTGVRVRQFDKGARKQVMSDRDKYKRAAKGDLAYNMMRMWQGAVGIAPEDGLISPAYVVASPLPGVDARYFTNLFRTPAYMGEVDNHSRGIVKDRNRLYWEDFKQIFSPNPPPDEQSAIADFVDTCSASIAKIVARVEREIELLNEYRTRLVADVVTGKLDVRAVAATLPEEQDELDIADAPGIDAGEAEEATDDDLADMEADA